MTIEKKQSALEEVFDQLSLDYADGDYLNIIGSNLGLDRPVFGFGDDLWRAVVRELALGYKQVATKFYALLALFYGPRITQVTNLEQAASIGDRILYVNDVSKFPQIGTLVLDEGLPNEETVTYCFIDRRENAIVLESAVGFSHEARSFDIEKPLMVANTLSTSIAVSNSNQFPTTDFPFTIVVGRGTPVEEVAEVTANDTDAGVLTLASALSNVHKKVVPTPIYTEIDQNYFASSVFLKLEDVTQWPSTGVFLTDPVGSFTATGGSASSVTVSAGTFTASRQVRHVVKFDGNITAALADVEAEVISNTDAALNFLDTLPASPASGDTFSVRVRAEYVNIDYDDSYLLLNRPIEDVSIPSTTRVEFEATKTTVALAGVKSEGIGWDIIQSTPRKVELLIPEGLEDAGTLRSASFVHTGVSGASTTLSAPASLGSSTLTVTSTAGFPLVGVVTINSGGGTEERVAYYVSSSTELTIPISATIHAHSAGESIDVYEDVHSTGAVIVGDHNAKDDTFAGPYVYDLGERAPTGTIAVMEAKTRLPGPTSVALEQEVNRTALEVKDATSFELTSFPYTVRVGNNTGNSEEVTVNDVNLARRASTTVATTAAPGVTEIEVSALTVGAGGDAADFPDANGYRVLLGKGTAEEEVVYVISTLTGPDRLVLEEATTLTHTATSTVELMADVLTTDPLQDDHKGLVARTQRSTVQSAGASKPTTTDALVSITEIVQPEVSEIELDPISGYATNFPTENGTAIINFGNGVTGVSSAISSTVSVGDTTLNVTSASSIFPALTPYIVVIGRGQTNEERVIVTTTNPSSIEIAGGTYGAKFAHSAGETVELVSGVQETVAYSTFTGTKLVLDTPIVFDTIHSSEELVVSSESQSDPRNTGYDFPLRMPTDPSVRLDFLIDLVRAAGVQVTIIDKR